MLEPFGAGPHFLFEQIEAEPRDPDLLGRSALVDKLHRRQAQGLPLQILNTDLDGSVYLLVWNNKQGVWEKRGDNRPAMNLLDQTHTPLIISTARNNWGNAQDLEIEKYGLSPPDAVSFGNGRGLLLRNRQGLLEEDRDYTNKVNSSFMTTSTLTGERVSQPYSPKVIIEVLKQKFDGQKQYLESIRIDNEGTPFAYVTMDVEDVPHDELRTLRSDVKEAVGGVNVGLAEDITTLADADSAEHGSKPKYKDRFSGWIIITPGASGKEFAIKYLGTSLSSMFPGGKILFHNIGDATIDTMLVFKVGEDEGFDSYGYGLGNLTPFMRESLGGARLPLNNDPVQAHYEQLLSEGPDGILEVVRRIT